MPETAVKERPILFAPPMVSAILAGRKGMTRRIVTFPSWMGGIDGAQPREIPFQFDGYQDMIPVVAGHIEAHCKCQFGYVGDRLWVREPWGLAAGNLKYLAVKYKADDQRVIIPGKTLRDVSNKWGWRHAKRMPRWASRLILEITGIKVERLNSISHEDAIAEGCEGTNWVASSPYIVGPHTDDGELPQEEFRTLWNSIHGPGSWELNPWVWAISFRRIED